MSSSYCFFFFFPSTTFSANQRRGTPPPIGKFPRAAVSGVGHRAGDDAVSAFWDYQSLFVSQREEASQPVSLRVVDGELPRDFPSGTYYLAGPGLFADDHGSTVHPLDGHGYLRAFRIDGARGTADFMARYIETEAQAEERNPATGEWRFTHRGPFSVLRGGKVIGNTKVMKNVANTSVFRWGGRLFCLWEGGHPYEIDPRRLKTLGQIDIAGDREISPAINSGFSGLAAKILRPILYGIFKMPAKRLLSHYKMDRTRNRLLLLSCNAEDMVLPRSNFTFYELDSELKVIQSKEFTIPDHLMIHDWAFTDSHYILIANRVKLHGPGSVRAVCGFSPMISALSVNPSKPTSPIYVLPRFQEEEKGGGGGRDWTDPIEAPSQMWVIHVGNAFETRGEKDAEGNLQIQIQATACSYHWFDFQKMFGYDWRRDGRLDPWEMMNLERGKEKLLPHLVQVTIDLEGGFNACRCVVNDDQWTKPADFPIINPDFSGVRSRFIYAATSSGSRPALPHFPFDTVVKLDAADDSASCWSTVPRRYIGEPIFIPRRNGGREGGEEDDGYILAVEYAVSTQRCYLVILDSRSIGKEEAVVARLQVPRHLNFPMGFHGFWAPTNHTL